MAGLLQPKECECGSTRSHREYHPERWTCNKCNKVIISRKKKPQAGICRNCGKSDSETPFSKWSNICISCKSIYYREYCRKNSDVLKEKQRASYQRDKKKRQAAVRTAIQRSPEAFLRYLMHHITKRSNHKRPYINKAALIVEIDYEYILCLYKKQKGYCALTNIPLGHKYNDLKTISIDRIDSSKGYIPGNVQLVCKAINLAKQKSTNNEFLGFIDDIITYKN